MISLQKIIKKDIKRNTKKPLTKLSIKEILNLIICEEGICYLENYFGAMAMGTKMKLQVLCDELSKRNFSEKSINDTLKEIRKGIKTDKKMIKIKLFYNEEKVKCLN